MHKKYQQGTFSSYTNNTSWFQEVAATWIYRTRQTKTDVDIFDYKIEQGRLLAWPLCSVSVDNFSSYTNNTAWFQEVAATWIYRTRQTKTDVDIFDYKIKQGRLLAWPLCSVSVDIKVTRLSATQWQGSGTSGDPRTDRLTFQSLQCPDFPPLTCGPHAW
jgi:hypothetical protein